MLTFFFNGFYLGVSDHIICLRRMVESKTDFKHEIELRRLVSYPVSFQTRANRKMRLGLFN
jgi:hypothetical protein